MTEMLNRLDAAIIGPGRAGTTLAAALARAGHRVVAVAGGSEASRARFRGFVAGARSYDDLTKATADTGLVVLSVPDDALEQVVTELVVADALRDGMRVIHLSGAIGLEPLGRAALAGARIAALHPAQTMTWEPFDPEALVGAAWAVTAPPDEQGWANELVYQLGGDPHDVGDDVRTLYHAALAMGSNAVGAAVALARQLLLAARVKDPGAFLGGLIETSATNVIAEGAAALTGPVVRGDVGTISQHLQALAKDLPHLLEPYRDLQAAVLAMAAPGMPADRMEDIAALLRSPVETEETRDAS